jgi:PKHD-type hydroxylase
MRQNWQLWEGVLSPSDCEEIISLCKETCEMQEATVFAQEQGASNNGVRKTKIGWTEHPKIQAIVHKYAHLANRYAFNVDASLTVATQFGEYTGGSHYDWHHDVNFSNEEYYDRKISVIVQLSDPSDYEGGDFQFKTIETPTGFKTQGSILCFLSYNEHRVTPVTEGTRYSLVNWMEGPRWR